MKAAELAEAIGSTPGFVPQVLGPDGEARVGSFRARSIGWLFAARVARADQRVGRRGVDRRPDRDEAVRRGRPPLFERPGVRDACGVESCSGGATASLASTTIADLETDAVMSTSIAARVDVASRSPWRVVALPDEHGGWALTAEAALLGLLIAPSASGVVLAFAGMLAFLARTPVKLVLVDVFRHRWLPRTRTSGDYRPFRIGRARSVGRRRRLMGGMVVVARASGGGTAGCGGTLVRHAQSQPTTRARALRRSRCRGTCRRGRSGRRRIRGVGSRGVAAPRGSLAGCDPARARGDRPDTAPAGRDAAAAGHASDRGGGRNHIGARRASIGARNGRCRPRDRGGYLVSARRASRSAKVLGLSQLGAGLGVVALAAAGVWVG